MFVPFMRELLRRPTFASTNIFVATDGGSKDEVRAIGVVDANSDLSFPSGKGSEDQSPFKQELSAILYTAKDMSQAAKRGAEGHVCLITDCQAAILAVLNLMLMCFPMLARSYRGSPLRQR